jgi:hypothetical protein
MLNLIASLSLNALDSVVLNYIKHNPGKRLHQIDKDTLRSHHQWGTKHIVERLESNNKIAVIRTLHGKKIAPRYFATL